MFELGGSPTSSGIAINETRAYNLSAVWNAVRAISGDIASLPLVLYQKQPDGGRRRATEHPLYPILHDSIGSITAFTWVETMLAHLLIRGNSYTRIYRDGFGRVAALRLYDPYTLTSIRADEFGFPIQYMFQNSKGADVVDAKDMLHVRGLSCDGIFGRGVLDVAAESLGLATAEMQYQSYYFGNNASPPGFIIVPGRANEQTLAALRKSWEDMYRGVKASGKPGILWEGMSYQTQNNSPANAQLLELRKFEVNEIARWFNIPPIKLQDNSGSVSYNSGEVQNRQYYDNCLRPWLTRIETECRAALLTASERESYYIEFLPGALLRADTVGRAQAYQIGIQAGYLSINDVRRMESLPPVDGGDVNLVPLNYAPLEYVAYGATFAPDIEDEPEGPDDTDGDAGGTGTGSPEPTTDGPPADEPADDSMRSRSVKARENFARAYRRMFADAAGRMLKREINDIHLAMKRHESLPDFTAWAEEYYGRETYMGLYMATAIWTYADVIASDLAEEHGREAKALEVFANDYVDSFVGFHKRRSLGEIKEMCKREGAYGAIEAMLGAWANDRNWAIADEQVQEIEIALRMWMEV